MSKKLTIIFLILLCQFVWGASRDGAIRTAKGYLSRSLKEESIRLKFPKSYNDALRIEEALRNLTLNLKSISCQERGFGLTTAEDREFYRKSQTLQFRLCDKHWLNSDEEVASTIIHEMSHLVVDVHDEIEASMNEIVIVYYGGGFPGLSYLQDDLNEENFEELLETEEFMGLREVGISNKNNFLYNLVCGYARYNYPNKLRGLLKKLSSEDRDSLINSQQNKLGLSPLMIAAREGFAESLKVLLEFGAQLDLKSKDGSTAFDLAKKNQKTDLSKLLSIK